MAAWMRARGSEAASARRDSDTPRDHGMSLAELIVTIGIMTLIGTMVMTVAVTVLKTFGGIEGRLDNTSQSALGTAASSKVLRTAIMPAQLDDRTCTSCASSTTAILSASTTLVRFYANTGAASVGPDLVTLRVVADPAHAGTGKLVQDTQPAIGLPNNQYQYCTAGAAGCVVRSRTLARGLIWPTPGIFTYYDYNGVKINQTTLTAANLPKVSSVDLLIKVNTHPGNDIPSRTAVSRVRLPNVASGDLTETSP